MTDRDYQHSRPLNVHRWSDHVEISYLVNAVFEKFISRKAVSYTHLTLPTTPYV